MSRLRATDLLRETCHGGRGEHGGHLEVFQLCKTSAPERNEAVQFFRSGKRLPRAEDSTRVRLELQVTRNQGRRGDGQLAALRG